jgi:hypothetical protein
MLRKRNNAVGSAVAGLKQPFAKSMNYTTRSIKCLSRDECAVFQLYPNEYAYISLEDAREMYELCQQIRKKDPLHADTVYEMHNMSKSGIETYLTIVEYFERCWCEDIEKYILSKNK